MGELSRMSRWNRLMAVGVILMVVTVLAAAAAFRWRTATTLAHLRTLAAQADRVADTGQNVLAGLLDAESSARAYQLTQAQGLMLSYTTARVRIAAGLGKLAAEAQPIPSLAADVAAIEAVTQSRLALLDRELRGPGAAPPGEASPGTAAATATMRQARLLIERLVRHAGEEEARRSAQEQAGAATIEFAVTLAIFGGVLLLGAATLALLAGRDRQARTQQALLAQSGLWQATVENLQDGVAVFDASGRLVQWNRNLAPLTGFSTGLLREGTGFARFVQAAAHWQPPVLAGDGPAPVWDGSRGGVQAAIETRANGRVIEVWRNAMPGGGHMLTIGDISRRVQAEAMVRQAQKMEVLGQLTGGVAHDFNNLLQVVSANLELLAAETDGPAPAPARLRGHVLAAMDGVDRGVRLTRHLLAFARQQPLAPEPVDAARLLSGLEEMLRRTLGPAITLEPVVSDGLWALRADALQLENAILNLAINGRDAMAGRPAGKARLTIEAKNATLDDAYCMANPQALPGDYVMLAVTDSGCGMTADQLERAVEPFYTTKPEGQGTGLGLAMVHGFAKQSGGHLKLHSQPGFGTSARLYIPRTRAPVRVQATAALRPQAGLGETVLLVEDDPGVRTAAALALSGLGYRVHEAPDPATGLAAIEQGLRPDVLLTDLMMPGALGAVAMAQRARALLPRLAVLFTSGFGDTAPAQDGPPDGEIDLIRKPWRLEELASRLRRALAAAQRPAAPRLRILLVEDDETVRQLTAAVLADAGHDVVAVGDAEAALRQVATAGLLITDLGLGAGGPDGLALAADARRVAPGLPVIVASGLDRPERCAEDLVWLNKPYDSAALSAAVDAALEAAQNRADAGPEFAAGTAG